MTPGKVYLVGAGPGHPELLTVKAVKLLEASDVIIYDRLIQEEVLALAKPSAERVYLGKSVGIHESRQQEICQILVRKAREGKTVVRLKGGDPFLFGRGGEEAEYLAEHGIPFEVVPGVSSALAAPASAGIAVTHRESASAVAIVTGHEAERENSRLNWSALAGIDTLVFLMAVHTVERVARELMAHGRDPQTPAAMIQMAFWHGEKVVTGTLTSIAGEVQRCGIEPPATLVIGEAVRLREKLKHAQRDLSRRPDSAAHFEPAPVPDQLLRMATAGMGSQVLRFALATSLFDRLEQWSTASELAHALGLNRSGLAEVLECLVSMGLLEVGPGGYRNLELATRYLVEASPQTLRPALLYQAAHLAPLSAVGRYLLNGREDGAHPEVQDLHRQSCECLAHYAAPFVLDKLDLMPHSPALLVGWGGDFYRDLVSGRWPKMALETRNPFAGNGRGDPAQSIGNGGQSYGVVLLSGLLGCCERGQFGPALEQASRVLRAGGLLVLHDAFVSTEAVPPPELLLSAFGRHVMQGGSRNWSIARLESELGSFGWRVLQREAIPGGTQLVTAGAM
ncbi:Uroporphyrinogen-III C-methyltransferase (modular protein) [Candidatus Sulfopaludibacter sp. SbA3]|nr:Uroporphyrinogen-III C-methyltransferase (modular protein) [Candidatus Sulfopaludibacter sp. SbA3]